MSLESETAAFLRADATLVALLPGGIYERARLGIEGIGSVSTPDAFEGGRLRPCALVAQRAPVPGGQITDLAEQVADARQVVEVWLYERVTQTAIDAAASRIYWLMQGESLPGFHSLAWSFSMDTIPEPGNLAPETMVGREDYAAMKVRRASA